MTELVSKDERFRHMDPITAGVVKDITKADLKLEMNKEGKVDMCKAIVDIKAEGKAEGIEIGMEKGMEKGENIILTVMQKLFSAGRNEDIQRMFDDQTYRRQLIAEFGLE